MGNRKYQHNTWQKAYMKYNDKYEWIWIFPYLDQEGKTQYHKRKEKPALTQDVKNILPSDLQKIYKKVLFDSSENPEGVKIGKYTRTIRDQDGQKEVEGEFRIQLIDSYFSPLEMNPMFRNYMMDIERNPGKYDPKAVEQFMAEYEDSKEYLGSMMQIYGSDKYTEEMIQLDKVPESHVEFESKKDAEDYLKKYLSGFNNKKKIKNHLQVKQFGKIEDINDIYPFYDFV